MSDAMRTGFPYIVATCVGVCFGFLAGGAVLFASQSANTAAPVEWVSAQPAQVIPIRHTQ